MEVLPKIITSDFSSSSSHCVDAVIVRPHAYKESGEWGSVWTSDLCEQGPVLFQLQLEKGGVCKGGIKKTFQSPVCSPVCPLGMEDCLTRERPDRHTRPAMLTYLGVSVTSLRREPGPGVFAAKREPRLGSHSLSPLPVFPPRVRQNPELFYKSWLRRSRPRLPSGVPPPRACACVRFSG